MHVLVATDVAGRGLDVKNLPYVVNYDFPTNLETYIHRIGRTGRLAAYGHAYSFFTRNLAPMAKDLVTLLDHHKQCIDPNLVTLRDSYKEAAQFMQDIHQIEQEDDDPVVEDKPQQGSFLDPLGDALGHQKRRRSSDDGVPRPVFAKKKRQCS